MKPAGLLLIAVMILIGLILPLNNCMTSTGREYYQLYLPPPPANLEENTAAPKIDKILLVESVEVGTFYNDYRMVYRTSPYSLNYYSYKYWIRKPELLIRDCIVDYLSDTKFFKQVIIKFARGEPDWQLKAVVRVLEEYDRPEAWHAHLKMELVVVEFKSGQQVLSHSFDRQVRLVKKKVEQFPIAVSLILKEELDIVMEKLN